MDGVTVSRNIVHDPGTVTPPNWFQFTESENKPNGALITYQIKERNYPRQNTAQDHHRQTSG